MSNDGDIRVPCKCTKGSVLVNDLDATSGGFWTCPWCGEFIEEYVVRAAIDSACTKDVCE